MKSIFSKAKDRTFDNCILISIFLLSLSYTGYAQKGNGVKDIEVRSCVEFIGNGLYQVNFSYDNPNKKEFTLNDDKSFVIHGNGKKKSKGINSFKPGLVKKAFSKQFSANEYVTWEVHNPNGNVHIATASANSSHCPEEYSGGIYPLFGQGNGKNINKIGLELTALAEGTAGDEPTDLVFQINGEKILLEIVPQNGKTTEVVNLLKNTFGLTYVGNPEIDDFLIDPDDIIFKGMHAIDVYFPIAELNNLNNHTDLINFVRPIYPSYKNMSDYIEITHSQGDAAQFSDIVRESFKIIKDDGTVVDVDGAGITIGVISDSYDKQPWSSDMSKAAWDVDNGDLPGAINPNGYTTNVTVLKDFPYGEASDEGRAMLQIIHDVAPGAELYFHTGVISPRNFELAIKALDEAGCSIITDDITFPGEPFFGDGNISNAIKDFTSDPENFYFTSAGNFADKGYSSVFNSSTSAPATNFISSGSSARAHVFGLNSDGSEDMLQKISVEKGTYMLALQWDEGLASQDNDSGAATDLDIYLVDDEGRLIVGVNRINDFGDPTEYLVFQALEAGEANIMITSVNGNPPPGLAIRYIAFRYQGLTFEEYGQAATVSGHAMSPDAITVGAVDHANWMNPTPDYFSSYGGLLSDNNTIDVDLLAPNNVNTNVGSIGQDTDGDGFMNFQGTSASAPHAAAAFALLMQAMPEWYSNGLASYGETVSDQVLNLFKDKATPAGTTENAGAGLINTLKAFKSIASQTTIITELEVLEGKTRSAETFLVKIHGKYFPDNPIVKFEGYENLIINEINTEENYIIAEVKPFTGNPGLVVYSPPSTEGGKDGGDSLPAKFFDDGKIAFNIVADDLSIVNENAVEYGDDILLDYTLEGLDDGVTLESLGLPNVKLKAANGVPYPDVNNYVIFPSFIVYKVEDYPNLDNYQINFKTGILQVIKKEMVIKPLNGEYTYGETINVSLEYLYNKDKISNNEDFLDEIKAAHEQDFYQDKDGESTYVLLNKPRGVINTLIEDLLENKSWMTSERIIQNKFRGTVNGMNFIDLEEQHFVDYKNSLDNPIGNKFRAQINKLRGIVNGFDLFNGNVDMAIENKVRGVINGTGMEYDLDSETNYSAIFAVIDIEDAPTDEEERSIDKLYAMNMLTGLEVTPDGEEHYVLPGAFLSPMSANFNITYEYARLKINPASLTFTCNSLVVNRGEEVDTSLIIPDIQGYISGENKEIVFPEGLHYQFLSDNYSYPDGMKSFYDIIVSNPYNYEIEYSGENGNLYVNPNIDDLKNVRSKLDCIEESTSDLGYIANFSYINPNSETIYILHGPDNYLSGVDYEGKPPVAFPPGEGTFSIPFDGQKLIWNLTTYIDTHKSSVSSEATLNSSKCNAKDIPAFKLYPSPFVNSFTVERTIFEAGTIEVFNLYGVLRETISLGNYSGEFIEIDMTGHPDGIYYVRITSGNDLYTYSMIKQ